MKSLRDLINEALNDSCILDVNNEQFTITYKNDTTSYDKKFKFALVLANFYTNHMNLYGWEDEPKYKENIKEVRLHDNNNWDLPEVIFSTDDKLLKDIIKSINNDDYFIERNHSKFTSRNIVNVNNFKNSIDLHSKKSFEKKVHEYFKSYVIKIDYDETVDRLHDFIDYEDNSDELINQLKNTKSIVDFMNSTNGWDKIFYSDKEEQEEFMKFVEKHDKRITKDVKNSFK